MKILPLVIVSALVGSGLGVALGYMSAGPLGGDQLAPPRADQPKLSPSEESTKPVARVERASFNFGAMQRGATRSHEFVVFNEGGSPLTLTPGDTTCKCTAFTASGGPVPPGGKGVVTLQWAAKTVAGPFRQSGVLLTNDPSNQRIDLTVEGTVVDAAGLEPKEFTLGLMGANESRQASVVLMSFESEDLTVTATAPTREGASPYELEVAPLKEAELPDSRAKSGVRITVTAGPGLPVGVLTEWVTLNTNLPAAESLQVPVFGRVEGDLSVHGAGWSADSGVLALGIVDSTKGKKTRLRVSMKGPGAEQAELEIKEVQPPELKVSLGDPRKVREQVVHVPLTVEVPQGTRPMVHLNTGRKPDGTYAYPEGVIRLSSSLESTPEIELRVRFAVEEPRR